MSKLSSDFVIKVTLLQVPSCHCHRADRILHLTLKGTAVIEK